MSKLRTLAIIDYVKQRKYCSSSDLARAFDVSPATIQRDIAEIVQQNVLRKVHGGIATIENVTTSETPAVNRHFTERSNVNPEKKRHIAQLAEQLIEDGDILFLDSSTTALYLARLLQKSTRTNLTIVTNSVLIIQEFYLMPPQFSLISLGGTFNLQLNSFLGRAALDNLRQLRLNKAFFSAVGMSRDAIFTYNESHAEFLRVVTEVAEDSHLLLDSSKFNKTALFPICETARIQSLITDAPLPEDIAPLIQHVHWEPADIPSSKP